MQQEHGLRAARGPAAAVAASVGLHVLAGVGFAWWLAPAPKPAPQRPPTRVAVWAGRAPRPAAAPAVVEAAAPAAAAVARATPSPRPSPRRALVPDAPAEPAPSRPAEDLDVDAGAGPALAPGLAAAEADAGAGAGAASAAAGTGGAGGAGGAAAAAGSGSAGGPASGDEVLPFGEGMTRPVCPTSGIVYPPQAIAARVAGTLQVKCHVLASGQVTRCRVVVPLPHVTEAVLDGMQRWVCTPATFQGRAVGVDVLIPVEVRARR